MPTVYLSKTTLTGGGATALDSIDGDSLVNNDIAHVWVSGVLYVYRLDATSGASESSPNIIAPDTNAGTKRWLLQNPMNTLNSGTAVDASSGSPTYVDFTSIPAWVKRITVLMSGVSTNGTSPVQIQIGDSGGIETADYVSGAMVQSNMITTSTSGFAIDVNAAAANLRSGAIVLEHMGSNIWIAHGNMYATSATYSTSCAGGKTLSATLDRVRITTVNGSDTFDAGTINILYE